MCLSRLHCRDLVCMKSVQEAEMRLALSWTSVQTGRSVPGDTSFNKKWTSRLVASKPCLGDFVNFV